MLVHAVYFWLKDDLSAADRDQFVKGLESLRTIEDAEACYIGVPAATDRPIIDRSYDYALVVVFRDMAAHDRYQVHPIHDRFRDECSQYWKKVLIYDSEG
ncbi:MAG: Dabb family protein [Acidobacteriota bacterium]|jgi:hypothetical protein|nr:MAG: transcription-repair coupling factor [Acidobacteriota bacterium]